MTPLIFKQSFLEKGKTRTVSGEMIITLNYVTISKPPIRSDSTEEIPLHKVETFIEGKLWREELELRNEFAVELYAKGVKRELEELLKLRANAEPEKTFTEKMHDLGFNIES